MAQSTLQGAEAQVAATDFGTVTDRRVVFYAKKGWFRGGSQEDLPLKHVTSVRLETNRQIAAGLVLLVLGLIFFAIDMTFFGILALAVAAILLWGSPRVVLNTAGSDLRVATGFPWTRDEAQTFVQAVQSQLFKD